MDRQYNRKNLNAIIVYIGVMYYTALGTGALGYGHMVFNTIAVCRRLFVIHGKRMRVNDAEYEPCS